MLIVSKHETAASAAVLLLLAVLGSCATGIEESAGGRGEGDAEGGDHRASADASLREGIDLFRRGDLKGAEPHLLEALRLSPRDHRILEMLGTVYARTDRFQQGEARYREAIAIAPGSATAWLGLVDVLTSAGDLDAALREVEAGLLRHQGHPGLASRRALLLARRADEGAEAAARSAIDLAPDDAEAHYALGLALQHQGRLQEARDALRAALDRQRGHIGALSRLATVEERLGNREAAAGIRREHGRALARLHVEERVRGRRQAAVEAFNREDYARALKELQAIALEDPEDPQVHLYLGSTHLALGDHERARAALRRSLNLDPRNERAYMELGRIEAMENRLDDAIASLRRAIEINPDFPEPHYFLAGVHRARGDMARFREEMETFQRLRSRAQGSAMELAPGAPGTEP